MNYAELMEFWVPVAEKLIPLGDCKPRSDDRGYRRYYMLDDLLGCHEYEHNYFRSGSQFSPLEDSLKKLLVTLRDSPHAHTILRAYQIQRGIKP